MTSTILVVDDEPINRQMLATLLGYVGHDVIEASDGVEALHAVRTHRPALVIADIKMPAMDGYELARQIRRDPDIAGTCIMFYTANSSGADAHKQAATFGIVHVLIKPSEPEVILSTVRAALARPDTRTLGT